MVLTKCIWYKWYLLIYCIFFDSISMLMYNNGLTQLANQNYYFL